MGTVSAEFPKEPSGTCMTVRLPKDMVHLALLMGRIILNYTALMLKEPTRKKGSAGIGIPVTDIMQATGKTIETSKGR